LVFALAASVRQGSTVRRASPSRRLGPLLARMLGAFDEWDDKVRLSESGSGLVEQVARACCGLSARFVLALISGQFHCASNRK